METNIQYLKDIGKISGNLGDLKAGLEPVNNNNNSPNNNSFLNNNSDDVSTSNSVIIHQTNNKSGKHNTTDIINTLREFSDEDISQACTLFLEEESGDVLRNNKLKINAGGLIGGMRKMKDGVAIFGKMNTAAEVNSDFELNLDESFKNNSGPYVFLIYYKKETNCYYIRGYREKANSISELILIKLNQHCELPLVKKEIIAMGDHYFHVNPTSECRLEIQNLGSSKELSNSNNNNSPHSHNKYIFEVNEYKTVTIGRDPKCTISFVGDKAFSKCQITFTYDSANKVWKVRDGSDEKESTNGTWIFATHSYEIQNNFVFRVGRSRVKITMC
jgi:hypothetical protein